MHLKKRLKRLRANHAVRNLVRETSVSSGDLILPYFVVDGEERKNPIRSMPGVYHLSIENLVKDITEAKKVGIPAVLLFGVTESKDDKASSAYGDKGIVQNAVRAIKREFSDLIVMTDVCLCGYTVHGHCGVIKNKKMDRGATLKTLAKIALSHVRAGADFVAPSAMADGQVRVIREALDKNGFEDAGILAYSAKYASGFYGPFREALGSAPEFGDRKSYQMDFANSDEALREAGEDIEEGADIVMIKPALSYLDIIYRVKRQFNMPVAAYNVSGEYSMIKVAAQKGLVDEKELMLEVLSSIKRAGADMIITYYAKEAAKWLAEK